MLKKVLGVMGVIFGVLGIVLAAAQLIGVWVAGPSVTQGLQQLTATLQNGLLTAEQAVTQSAELAGELNTRLAERPEDLQPLLERLDASIGRVQSALTYADQTIQTLQTMTAATARLPLPGRNQEETTVGGKLDQAAQAVDSANQTVTELEGLSASLAQRGGPSLDQVEARLQTMESQLNTLAARIDEAQAQIAQIEGQIPLWVNWATVALTLLFIWLGIAQYCLLILSLRWVRQPENGLEATTTDS
ncbi:MAG TPA: hypothetical protein PKE45_00905 [Caldilineaceae bacterium]|nr:hypothetical protein [Caldilineaceae bacterium]